METVFDKPKVAKEVEHALGHALLILFFMIFFGIVLGGLVAPFFLPKLLREAEKETEKEATKARAGGYYTEDWHRRKRKELRQFAYITAIIWFFAGWGLMIFGYYPYIRNGFI